MDTRNGIIDWGKLHPQQLVDREKELGAIKRAFEEGETVVYLVGKGGIGKTRLLEEVCERQEKVSFPEFVPIGIFDVYHPRYHRVSGIEAAIAKGIQEKIKDENAFAGYRKARDAYENARQAGLTSKSLEESRETVALAFWKDFKTAAEKHKAKHFVFCFDTLELLFHEADEVEKLLGERPRGLGLADWLSDALKQDISNVHLLLAGRPKTNWWKTLAETKVGKEIRLGSLDEESVGKYLKSIELDDADAEVVWKWTHGEPLRLVFVTILMASGRILPPPPVSDVKIDQALIDEIMKLTDDMSVALPYIAFLAKGATPELLSRAMKKAWEDEWNKDKAERFLGWFRNMPFVKIRPSDERVFLHDEMYEVMREYVLSGSGMEFDMKDAAKEIVAYYREHPQMPRSEMVYYSLCKSWKEGFDEYRKLSDEAIAEHRTGDDLLLRDEIFHFISDYGYKHLAPQVNKDSIIRWPKRLLSMGEYKQAKALAERVRGTDLFASLDPKEQAVFSVYEAEAKLYTGDIDAGMALLDEATEALGSGMGKEPESYEERRQRQAYIRAHNDMGYANARFHDYWKASEAYGKALESYNHLVPSQNAENWEVSLKEIEKEYGKSVISDWADTLKNLAFAYSKLGFHRSAHLLAGESDTLYKWVDNEYGHGMTMSALGAILDEREWYCNSRRVLESALGIFQQDGEVSDERGEALVCLSLGQTLRKLVDMENVQGRESEFEHFLNESEDYILRAREIFSKKEPSRLPEVYQALGCLYRDKLAFVARAHGTKAEMAEDHRKKSTEYLDKALDKAETPLQKADIWVDKAEVCYHYYYREGYGDNAALDEEAKATLGKRLNQAIELVPNVFRYPYRPPYPPEEQKNTLWWKIMGKVHLLKGNVLFKAGDFEGAIEAYLESFLFLDLYSEEAALFSVVSRSGRRLYSKLSRVSERTLRSMEDVLLEKGAKRRIMDRPGWRALLSLVQDARLHAEPYVLRRWER